MRTRSLFSATSTRWRDAHSLRRAIVVVAGLRLGLGLLAWVSLLIVPAAPPGGDWRQLALPTSSAWWPVVGPWQHWDAFWYQHIATSGYAAHGSDAAFFPLYPIATHVVAAATAADEALAGFVVSTVAMVIALALLDRLITRDFDAATARRGVLYVALAPVAFFFVAPFTEALFLALSIATVLAARNRSWWQAGVCGFLAALCRPTGVLLALPVLIESVIATREMRRYHRRGVHAGYAAVAAPVAALAAFTAYTLVVLNVPGGSFGAASGWGQKPTLPWVAIVDSVQTIAAGTHPEEILNLVAAVALIVAIPFMVRRMPLSYVAYAAAMVPVVAFRTATTSPLMSADRYVLVVFPLFILLAIAGRRTWVNRMVLSLFATSLAVLTVVFVHDGFIG